MVQRRFVLLLVCAVAGAGAALAGAASSGPPFVAAASQQKPKPKRTPVKKSPDLWATINVCDTEEHPNTVGIRGSMPGLGRPAKLAMRFRVQFQQPDGSWSFADQTADSGFKPVGSTAKRVIESGQNFMFVPPATGAHTLRGVVDYRWTTPKGKPLKTLRRLTSVGHRSTAGSDPTGYSAQTCQIVAP